MPLYKKRPVIIQAFRWWPDLPVEAGRVAAWLQMHGATFRVLESKELFIGTLEDGRDLQVEHVASVGDYIVRGVTGEFYPCKAEIFEATHDPVNLRPVETAAAQCYDDAEEKRGRELERREAEQRASVRDYTGGPFV